MSRVIRGRKIYNKNNNDDNNRKGFTLIEVLAVVVVIALVVGIGISVYLNAMEKSKKESSTLAINNIMDAAELYGMEAKEIRWLNSYEMSDSEENLKVKEEFVCITVNDLINNGYFKEDFYKSEIYEKAEITGNSYIKIVRDNDNKANYKINVLPGVTDRNKCELSDDDIKIEVKNSYTDTIEFRYKDKYESSDYSYYFKQFSDNLKKRSGTLTSGEGDITFSGLTNNTKYVLSICSVYDGVKNCSHRDTYTEDFVDTDIKSTDADKWAQYKKVNILFSDENIKEGARYYFKSDIDARIDHGTVYDCSSNDIPSDSCLTSVSEVKAGEWYYVSNKRVVLYISSNLDSKGKIIYARVYDKTGNVNHVEANVNKVDSSSPSKPDSVVRINSNSGEIRDNGNSSWSIDNLWWGDFSSFDEGDSGIKYYEYSKNCTGDVDGEINFDYSKIYGDGTNVSYCIRAVDNANNKSEWSDVTYLKVDQTIPVLNINKTVDSVDGAAYDGEWTNKIVYTKLTFSDGSSGINPSTLTCWESEENKNYYNTSLTSYTYYWQAERDSEVYCSVCDNVGNCTTKSFDVKIDKTVPTCKVSKTNTNTTSGVTATFTCSDSASGVVACTDEQTGLKSNGSYTIKDNAGNSGTCSVSVTSSTKWRCKECSTCKRCASAGCSTYNNWKLPTKNANGCYPNYYGYYTSKSSCNNGKPSDTNYTQYICTDTNDYACTGGTNVFKYFKKTRTCNTYKRSCSSCKCETWSSTWTGYDYTSDGSDSNTKCESAIFYS